MREGGRKRLERIESLRDNAGWNVCILFVSIYIFWEFFYDLNLLFKKIEKERRGGLEGFHVECVFLEGVEDK